uniref:Uncharacterized protein n=1 Tax=Panagrolaimus sp. JU765 TaxID=591449 RepID=A0AC34Q2D0_9BILA
MNFSVFILGLCCIVGIQGYIHVWECMKVHEDEYFVIIGRLKRDIMDGKSSPQQCEALFNDRQRFRQLLVETCRAPEEYFDRVSRGYVATITRELGLNCPGFFDYDSNP